MSPDQDTRKKRPVLKTVVVVFILILSIAGFYLYNNFNRLLTDALMDTFNSHIISDVYELKFEKLRVNIFEGNVSVSNVVMQPRETPERSYPYINSSLRLTTEKLTLKNVQLFTFLKSKKLNLESIIIMKPEIRIKVGGERAVLFPFKDSVTTEAIHQEEKKKAMESFFLDEFQLVDASIHITNSFKHRNFTIKNFTISVDDLTIHQDPGKDLVAVNQANVTIGDFTANLQKGGLKHIGLKDFKIGIDSLKFENSVDTMTFRLRDFTTGLNALDIQTTDSIFHITMKSFNGSYRDKSITLDSLSFKPNISDAAMQNRFAFQHTALSGDVGSIKITGINFDSIIYHRNIFIDEVVVDKPAVSIFKDNTKPMDKNRFPKYFGQQISAIPIPIRIKHVTLTHVGLVNVERKRDSTYAKIFIRRGTVNVRNFTNLSKKLPLAIEADAYLVDKVHFNVRLDFSYKEPQFTVVGKLDKFNLPDLNPVLLAYTPATIRAGTADEITFSTDINLTGSSGTMKFLYHDLDVDLELKEKAKWKSDVLAFAANSIVNASNPGSSDLPPRVVQLHSARDMNKGFVNIIIKSILNGVKETMVMSKENRKAYKEAKKVSKQQKKGK